MLDLPDQKNLDIVYFFQTTGNEVELLFNAAGIAFANRQKVLVAEDRINLWSARAFLDQRVIPDGLIWGAEFHPIRTTNLELISSLPVHAEIRFYTTLDNAFYRAIGMGSTISMMDSLGLKENDSIEHKLVNKALVRTQEKMESRVGTARDAESLDEWVEINVPN